MIKQSENGYRFSVDAVLLANFVDEPHDNRIVDFGTGSGIIPIIMAAERGYTDLTGIEIQESLAEVARENVELNETGNRIKIIHDDFCKYFKKSGKKFDAVITNPPYMKPGSGKINPDSEKAIARHEIKCSLELLITAAREATVKKGALYIIYHPHRLDELIALLVGEEYHIERLQMIHSRKGESASLFMLKAVKKSTHELEIADPVYIYDQNGSYTPHLKKILHED